MTPAEKLKEWIALSEKTTEGPWTVLEGNYVGFLGRSFFNVISGEISVVNGKSELEDCQFIAASKNIVPAVQELMAELEKVKEENKRLDLSLKIPMSFFDCSERVTELEKERDTLKALESLNNKRIDEQDIEIDTLAARVKELEAARLAEKALEKK